MAAGLTYFLIEEKAYPDVLVDKFKRFKIVAEATLGVAKGHRGATSEINAHIPRTVLAQRRRLMQPTITHPWKCERRNPHQPNRPTAKQSRQRVCFFFDDKRNGKKCCKGCARDFKHFNTVYEPSWRPVQLHVFAVLKMISITSNLCLRC